jgi:hypothetical protein
VAARGGRPAERLLLPFFGLGLLIVLGKILAARGISVDNAPVSLAGGLGDLLWHTARSPALSIWYLFVLFVVSLGSMLLLVGRRARMPWLLGFCAMLYLLPLPSYVYLDRIGTYAVFFGLGAQAGFAGDRWERWMDRLWPVLLALLLAGLAGVAWLGADFPEKMILLPLGALSMPALHGWLRFYGTKSPRVFLLLGRYSFMIYLFNTSFIGLTKGILLNFWSWDAGHFLPFAMVLMAAGIFGPMGLKRVAFRRVLVLDRLTD